MKLFFMPGACSLTVHVALIMTGRDFRIVQVDYTTRRSSEGQSYLDVNPKGYVPALETSDGQVFTEIPVIIQYLDNYAPEAKLLPVGEYQRLRLFEWLHFLATEIHKSFSPLYRPDTPSSFLEVGRRHLTKRIAVIEASLQNCPYLLGEECSIADVYLYTMCRWLEDQDLDHSQWPALREHYRRIEAKPAVQSALSKEGLARRLVG